MMSATVISRHWARVEVPTRQRAARGRPDARRNGRQAPPPPPPSPPRAAPVKPRAARPPTDRAGAGESPSPIASRRTLVLGRRAKGNLRAADTLVQPAIMLRRRFSRYPRPAPRGTGMFSVLEACPGGREGAGPSREPLGCGGGAPSYGGRATSRGRPPPPTARTRPAARQAPPGASWRGNLSCARTSASARRHLPAHICAPGGTCEPAHALTSRGGA